jgi:hypothetical protein
VLTATDPTIRQIAPRRAIKSLLIFVSTFFVVSAGRIRYGGIIDDVGADRDRSDNQTNRAEKSDKKLLHLVSTFFVASAVGMIRYGGIIDNVVLTATDRTDRPQKSNKGSRRFLIWSPLSLRFLCVPPNKKLP